MKQPLCAGLGVSLLSEVLLMNDLGFVDLVYEVVLNEKDLLHRVLDACLKNLFALRTFDRNSLFNWHGIESRLRPNSFSGQGTEKACLSMISELYSFDKRAVILSDPVLERQIKLGTAV